MVVVWQKAARARGRMRVMQQGRRDPNKPKEYQPYVQAVQWRTGSSLPGSGRKLVLGEHLGGERIRNK